jgi:hypothetical protein
MTIIVIITALLLYEMTFCPPRLSIHIYNVKIQNYLVTRRRLVAEEETGRQEICQAVAHFFKSLSEI